MLSKFTQNCFQVFSEKDQKYVFTLVDKFKNSYGINAIKKKYYPELNQANLANTISFVNDKDSTNHFEVTDLLEDEFDQSFEVEDSSVFEDDYDSSWTENSFASKAPKSVSNREFFLVVDYDVAPDGSRRDFSPAQVIGNPRKGLEQLAYSPLSTPKLANDNVSFVHRAYLGVANYSIFQIRNQFPSLYSKIRKKVNSLKGSEVANDQYNLALIYMYFSWLNIEDSQIDRLLLAAANNNHPRAQFEYGIKLYREQRQVEESIKWIERAAQEGVTEAQFRLGKMLLDSPFVKSDQRKAYFWLNAASYNGHKTALKHLTHLKLDSNVEELINVEQAIENLDLLQEDLKNDPEYYYLRALAYKNMEQRRLDLAVTSIREAIDLADDYSWDNSQWKNTLKKWTSGGAVTIVEMTEE